VKVNSIDEQVKILFVDDEVNVLRSLRRLFMDEDNYELLFAESGEEGLEILEQEPGVSVVVSDYRMPQMNGVEFFRQVHERWPDTIRIVLSGFADTVAVVEAINIGHVYKFIPKPWNDEELRVNIANAVETFYLNRTNSKLSAQLEERNRELLLINAHLEDVVQQRTQALELRSQVLQLAQDILDCLPVAVFGIDIEDCVVQANDKATRILAPDSMLLGEKSDDVLPSSLLALIELIKSAGAATERIECGDGEYIATGSYLNDDRDRGIIIAMIPVHLLLRAQ